MIEPWRDDLVETRVLRRPVFVVENPGRRRLFRRAGYLAAAGSITYLAMLGFLLVAGPAVRLPVPQAGAHPAHSAHPRHPGLRVSRPPVLRLARPPVNLPAGGVVVAHAVATLPAPPHPAVNRAPSAAVPRARAAHHDTPSTTTRTATAKPRT